MSFSITYPDTDLAHYVSNSDALSKVRSAVEKDHIEAIREAVDLGSSRKELDAETLVSWHDRILQSRGEKVDTDRHQTQVSHLETFISKLNEDLANPSLLRSDANRVTLLARTYLGLHEEAPFNRAQDATARILINYVAARIASPLMVFREEELDEMQVAKESLVHAQLYFGKKVRERVFNRMMTVLDQVDQSGQTYEYASQDGQKLYVEWHQLFASESEWKKSAGIV